jgi:hypothetical protein
VASKKIENELRERIASAVAAGFDDREDIVAEVTESAEDEFEVDDLEPLVERLTDEAVAAHHRRQARWKGPTDCERLDLAFEALERQGIVARQNFTCCSNCGHYEIGDEIAAVRKKRRGPVVGYAFYHMQDTESAVEGGGIYIKYDTLKGDDEAKAAVGQKIVDVLNAAGLRTEWDGNPNTAVYVRLNWRKRRPAEELAGG